MDELGIAALFWQNQMASGAVSLLCVGVVTTGQSCYSRRHLFRVL